MKPHSLSLSPALSSLVLSLMLCQSGNARTFTSDSGVVIEAEIQDVTDTQVQLLRADGKTFRTEIARFAAADQKFIREWAQSHRVLRLGVEGKAEHGPSREATAFEGKGKGNDCWYEFTISNKSTAATGAAEKVVIEYVLFPVAGQPAVTPDGNPGGTGGRAELVRVEAGKSASVQTVKAFALAPSGSGTSRGIGGGTATVGVNTSGSLAGVYCEISVGGKSVLRQIWGKVPADPDTALAAWRETEAKKEK